AVSRGGAHRELVFFVNEVVGCLDFGELHCALIRCWGEGYWADRRFHFALGLSSGAVCACANGPAFVSSRRCLHWRRCGYNPADRGVSCSSFIHPGGLNVDFGDVVVEAGEELSDAESLDLFGLGLLGLGERDGVECGFDFEHEPLSSEDPVVAVAEVALVDAA